MARRKRYSKAQKRAYYSGQAYRAGASGKRIRFRNRRNRDSFRSGYRSARHKVRRMRKV